MKIYCGRRDYGNGGFFKDIEISLLETRKEQYVIVPEQSTVLAEEELMETLQLSGLFNINVLSMKSLEMKIRTEIGGNDNFIDEIGKKMQIRKALKETESSLKLYGTVSSKSGFLEELNYIFKSFKSDGISPEDLLNVGDSKKIPSIVLDKLKDLSSIYKELNSLSEKENVYDESDIYTLLSENIQKSKQIKGCGFWFYGFDVFSNQEYSVIDSLVKNGNTVNIGLVYDRDNFAEDREVFKASEMTYFKLIQIAKDNFIDYEVKTSYSRMSETELEYLEKHLFTHSTEPFLEKYSENQISLVQRSSIWEESSAAAEEIIRLVRDEGYLYHDVAVMISDDEYLMPLELTFKQYGIPFFMDKKVDLAKTPFVKMVTAALETISRNFDYEDTFNFLKSEFSDITQTECDLLENYVIFNGIKGSKTWSEPFDESVEHIRIKAVTELLEFKKNYKKSKTYQEKTVVLYNFLDRIKAYDKLENLIQKKLESGDFSGASGYSQIWNDFISILDQINLSLGKEKASMNEYMEVLKAGYQSYKIGQLPLEKDVVSVITLDRSRVHRIKELIILGANQGRFPKEDNSSTIFNKDEFMYIKDTDLFAKSSIAYKQYVNMFNVRKALTLPEERLVISSSMTNLKGELLEPSFLVARINRLFPYLMVSTKDKYGHLSGSDIASFHILPYLKKKEDEGVTVPLWDFVEECLNEENKIDWDVLSYTGINDEPIDLGEVSIYETSISQVESYSRCPFLFFMDNLIKPTVRPDYSFNYIDFGSIMHNLLNYVFTKTDIRTIKTEQIEGIVDEALKTHLDNYLKKLENSNHDRYLVKKIKRVAMRVIYELTRQINDGLFTNYANEKQFSSFIKGDSLSVKVNGAIDRMDICAANDEKYVKVIDYKSSHRSIDFSDLYNGLSIQLPLYLSVAEKMMGSDYKPAGSFYFELNDPILLCEDPDKVEKEREKYFKMDGIVLNDDAVISYIGEKNINTSSEKRLSVDEFKLLNNFIDELIIERSRNIIDGDVSVKPIVKDSYSPCSYCKYKSVCQFDERFCKKNEIEENLKKDAFFDLIRKKGNKS